jgi:nicotinamide phosphoribosyltransferase
MKATHVVVDGKSIDIFKKPVTDNGMKNSAKGRLAVLKDNSGNLYLKDQATPDEEVASELKPVWKDGDFLVYEDYKTIRERALKQL